MLQFLCSKKLYAEETKGKVEKKLKWEREKIIIYDEIESFQPLESFLEAHNDCTW